MMAHRPGVRVDGSSGRPTSARRTKTVQERRAEIVAANARLRSQLSRETGGRSNDGVTVRPSADPDLRTLETQQDTLRAQLRQLMGVLASRRDELAELRRSTACRSQPVPAPSQRANGPHGDFQEYVVPASPAAATELNTSALAPSDLDDSDYTELDFANDAAVVAAEGWGDETVLPEDRDGDWREDMMSVISRDKRAAERGSSRSLLSVELGSTGSGSGSNPNAVDTGCHSGTSSDGGGNGRHAVATPAPTLASAQASTDGRTDSTVSITVAAYDWSDEDQVYRHSSSSRILVDLLRPQQGAGALQLSPAELFYGSVKEEVGWDAAKHGTFVINDCVASEGPGAPDIFGDSTSPEEANGLQCGNSSAQPLLDAFTVRGLGLWNGCTVQVRRPDPRAPLC